MTYAPVFAFMGALALAVGLLARDWVFKLLPLYVGAAYLAVALAYVLHWPGIWLKRTNGRLSWLSWALLAPVHGFARLNLSSFITGCGEAAFHEVVPGLYLGRILREWEGKVMGPIKPHAVLDLTAEFPAPSFFRLAPAYLCLPTLDTAAPTVDQIQTGVEFLTRHLPSGPVYVHCAFGHGRSAVLVIAWLLDVGHQSDVEEATEWLRFQRPGVCLNRDQFQALRAWFKQRKVEPHG